MHYTEWCGLLTLTMYKEEIDYAIYATASTSAVLYGFTPVSF